MADEPKTAKNAIWITSGLAIVAACVAATMEYGSATRLERQKFEYSLIEKALVSDDGILIEEDSDRKEATKRLEFLINIGVIRTLDKDAIRQATQNPSELPIFQGSTVPPRSIRVKYLCYNVTGGIPAMAIQRAYPSFEIRQETRSVVTALIKFPTQSSGREAAEERCEAVAANFNKIEQENTLPFLKVSQVNNQFVLCTNELATGTCDDIAITLSSEEEAREVLSKLTSDQSEAEPLLLQGSS